MTKTVKGRPTKKTDKGRKVIGKPTPKKAKKIRKKRVVLA